LKLSARNLDIIRAMISRFFDAVGYGHYLISTIQYLPVAYSVKLQNFITADHMFVKFHTETLTVLTFEQKRRLPWPPQWADDPRDQTKQHTRFSSCHQIKTTLWGLFQIFLQLKPSSFQQRQISARVIILS